MNTSEYWENFKKENNLNNINYYDAFSFGMNDIEADELLSLVLEEKKKATTSVYLENEKYPKIGDYSIVLDSNNEPKCIIKTTNYTIMPFKDMTYDIAKKEGEDECLETWISTHKKMFISEGKEYGYKFNEELKIFFEEFQVVYK